jgi:isoleucyl-tRNA synthetase
MPEPDDTFINPELADKWDQIFKQRGEVLKALEEARNLGIIGHSLDATVALYPHLYKKSDAAFWKDGAGIDVRDILIVSWLDATGTEDPGDTSEEIMQSMEGASEAFGPVDESGVRNKKIRYISPLFGGPIVVMRAEGEKCERCWKYDVAISKDSNLRVCPRCAAVLNAGVSA